MQKQYSLFIAILSVLSSDLVLSQPDRVIDIARLSPDQGYLTRVSGHAGRGNLGVPVAGPGDIDGDGFQDFAVAYMTADPLGRQNAGEVDVVFGNGAIGESIDTALDQNRLLRIYGDQSSETAGSEIWIDDVSGDGLADVLICRQNFDPGERSGAGALTILFGSPQLREQAGSLSAIDLSAPPPELPILTLVGATTGDRLGIWARTGDVDGDGVLDIAVGADQESDGSTNHHGALYVVRGGSHLNGPATVDLGDFGSTALAGQIARIVPPSPSPEFHFSATCNLADLDGNGRAEVLSAATLNRAGASLQPSGGGSHPFGGFCEEVMGNCIPRGRLYILWDDAFPEVPWPAGFTIDISSDEVPTTAITGGQFSRSFGEEIIGGLDFDRDGNAELFAGDLTGGLPGCLANAGAGIVFWEARLLRDLEFDLDNAPQEVGSTAICGPRTGSIASDTVAQGDFDGDGFADIAIANPHDSFDDDAGSLRISAGTIHILFGQRGRWPELVLTAVGQLPPTSEVRITVIQGARGRGPGDQGDTLSYSASSGDVDGDGLTDLITNEMTGNGVAPEAVDVGNLIVLPGAILASPPQSRPTPGRPVRDRPSKPR